MTYMTETGRIRASGRCSPQRGRTVPDRGAPFAAVGMPVACAWALPGTTSANDDDGIEGRAFPRGNDS